MKVTQELEVRELPSSAGGGVAEGRGGVVQEFLDHTTPSARANEASRLFLFVQPPLLLLRRGVPAPNAFGHFAVCVLSVLSVSLW
jgi:hypothetical protein